MQWKLSIFSLLLFLSGIKACAQQGSDAVAGPDTLWQRKSSLERVERMRSRWNRLFPSQLVVQNAGNMGVVSAGVGWSYGCRRQWETALLAGFIPRHQSDCAKMTMTLKQNYMPWRIALGDRWHFEPLRFGLYVNTVFGEQFWGEQPHRYPANYYGFSTRYRLNVCLGSQLHFLIPSGRNRSAFERVGLFYEVSTCDLYFRSKVLGGNLSWSDILGLSLGIALQL